MCVHRTVHIVAQNIAQNRPDSFPPYPPDNHHSSDDVYLREGGAAQLITSWTHLEIVNENASTIDGTWAINLCIVTHSAYRCSDSPAHDFRSGELGQSYTLQLPQSRLHRLLLIYVSNSGLLLVQRQSVDHALRAAPLHQSRAAPTSTTPTFITHRKPCDFHIV